MAKLLPCDAFLNRLLDPGVDIFVMDSGLIWNKSIDSLVKIYRSTLLDQDF